MISLDEFLNSSLLIWTIIALGILHVYLKKTGQTLPEFVAKIRDMFSETTEEVTKK